MSVFPLTKVSIKSLFGKPATAMYPVVPKVYNPNTRGMITNNLEECNFCGLCQKRCPAGAIEVCRPDKTWTIDPLRCISCNFCVELCAKKSLGVVPR